MKAIGVVAEQLASQVLLLGVGVVALEDDAHLATDAASHRKIFHGRSGAELIHGLAATIVI